MKTILSILTISLTLLTNQGYADLIYLKNNVALYCDILEENDTNVIIKTLQKSKNIKKTRIQGILYENDYQLPPLIKYSTMLEKINSSSAKAQFKIAVFCLNNQLLNPAMQHFLLAQQLDSNYSVKVSAKLEQLNQIQTKVMLELSKINYTLGNFETASKSLTQLLNYQSALLFKKMLPKANALLEKTNKKIEENQQLYKTDVQALKLLGKDIIVYPNNEAECQKITDLLKILFEKDPTKINLLSLYLQEARQLITNRSNTFDDIKMADHLTTILNIILVHKKMISDTKLKQQVIRLHDIIFHIKNKFMRQKIQLPLLKKNLKVIKAILYTFEPEERQMYSLFAYEYGIKLKKKAQNYRFTDLNKYKKYLHSAIKCFKIHFATVEKESKARLATLLIQECNKELNNIKLEQLLSDKI